MSADLIAVRAKFAELRDGKCSRCRGIGRISVKHGETFDTDSKDEIRDACHQEPCPVCRVAVYDLLEALIDEREAMDVARGPSNWARLNWGKFHKAERFCDAALERFAGGM